MEPQNAFSQVGTDAPAKFRTASEQGYPSYCNSPASGGVCSEEHFGNRGQRQRAPLMPSLMWPPRKDSRIHSQRRFDHQSIAMLAR